MKKIFYVGVLIIFSLLFATNAYAGQLNDYPFHNGTARNAYAIETNGVKIITPLDLDESKQKIDIFELYTAWMELPLILRENIKTIELVDYSPSESKALASYTKSTQSITVYQNNPNSEQTAEERIKPLLTHEAAHGLWFKLNLDKFYLWDYIIVNDFAEVEKMWVSSKHTEPEDFANSVTEYVNADKFPGFKERFPNRYKFIENILKDL